MDLSKELSYLLKHGLLLLSATFAFPVDGAEPSFPRLICGILLAAYLWVGLSATAMMLFADSKVLLAAGITPIQKRPLPCRASLAATSLLLFGFLFEAGWTATAMAAMAYWGVTYKVHENYLEAVKNDCESETGTDG